MQLPKCNPLKKKRKLLKHCQYLDCGKEFLGVAVQKYCDFHTDSHNRKKYRPTPENPQIKNQVFNHKLSCLTAIQFTCALEGCGQLFTLDIYPRQYVYPKYCDEHRSEFRREFFLNGRGSCHNSMTSLVGKEYLS